MRTRDFVVHVVSHCYGKLLVVKVPSKSLGDLVFFMYAAPFPVALHGAKMIKAEIYYGIG
eukprot:5099015-Ditylum_brightwellii.AAC.1